MSSFLERHAGAPSLGEPRTGTPRCQESSSSSPEPPAKDRGRHRPDEVRPRRRHRARRRVRQQLTALLSAVGLVSIAAYAWLQTSDRPAPHECWQSIFDGYGRNEEKDGVFYLRPKAPASSAETHASLVVSADSFDDVDFEAEIRTLRRLRVPHPNPWEVAWVVWNYSDRFHFYYLLLKPHGWELGKAHPGEPGNQRFLATGEMQIFPPDRWYTVRVQQEGPTVNVTVDGEHLTTFTDRHQPYLAGKVGFYIEDAEGAYRPTRLAGACA